MSPRYPQIRVRTSSRNPWMLVAAVRQGLRRAEVAKEEIDRFSRQALAEREPRRMREVCRRWAVLDTPPRL